MPFVYRFDIMKKLEREGYSRHVLVTKKILSPTQCAILRRREPFGLNTLNTICCLLDCQPGDLLRFEQQKKTNKKVVGLDC